MSGRAVELSSLAARSLSVLVVSDQLPMYDRDARSLRIQRSVEAMVAEGHRVTFLGRAGHGQERYAEGLRDLGVEVHAVDARRLRARGEAVPGLGIDLRMLLRRGRFDVAYLNLCDIAEQYLPEIRAHSSATRIIVNSHEVHYLGQQHAAERSGDALALATAARTRVREAAIYAQADLLCAVSDDDRRALEELAPAVPVERVDDAAAVDSLRRAFATAVPACFVARVAAWSSDTAAEIVGGYIAAFTEDDPVMLVVPVTPSDPDANAVGALLAGAIERAGGDPERVPDIAVIACAEMPPLPSQAVTVEARSPEPLAGAAPVAVPGTGAIATIAASDDPREWIAAAGGRRPSEPSDPRVSIIIPAYNQREVTESCLAALERDLGDRLGDTIELVLVDNGSSDSTAELFAEWSPRATVVRLTENCNFAGGANAGARAATGEVLVLVTNDIEVGPGAIDALVQEVTEPGVGLVGARLCYPDGRLQHGGYGWRRLANGLLGFHLFHYESGMLPLAGATLEIGAVTGACTAFRADLFRLVGGYDEGYVNGWEDIDLCQQIRSTGAAVRYRGDVEIVHHEGVTAGGRYNEHGNPQRFFGRWGPMLTDDNALLRDAFGACLSPIIDFPVPGDEVGGAPVRLIGPVSGVGPYAAEARGILRALQGGGVDVAARTIAPVWIGPSLDQERWEDLARVHLRSARPDSTTVSVGDEGRASDEAQVLRVAGDLARRPRGAVAWAPCPAARELLIGRGWPAGAVELVPPIGIEGARGGGGGGILVLAPTHDRRLMAALLASLRESGQTSVRMLPSVRTPDIRRALHAALPGAELLAPCTDELAFAALAAESDMVISVDPADAFERFALTAAASGAAVAVRAGGPAAWVLSELAVVIDAFAPSFLSTALASQASDTSASARGNRAAAVLGACGVHATALTLERLLGLPGPALTQAA